MMHDTHRRRGIALILCFLVLTLLSVVVLELVYTAQVERSLARNSRDGLENETAARSGAELAAAILAEEWGTFDSPEAEWARERSGIPAGGAELSFSVADEEGKLNLGLVVHPDEAVRTWARAALRRLLELAREGTDDPEEPSAEAMMEAIVKWGERGEAKEGLKPGGGGLMQEDKVRRFLTLRELLFLEGFTESLVFGERKTAGEEAKDLRSRAGERGLAFGDAGSLEELATSLDEEAAGAAKEAVPLADVLTVWGDGKVNLNTAPLPVLQALHPSMTADLVAKLDQKRREIPKPPEGAGAGVPPAADELRQIEGFVDTSKTPPVDLATALKDRVKVKSSVFRVRIVVKNERLTQRWEAVVKADGGQAAAAPAAPAPGAPATPVPPTPGGEEKKEEPPPPEGQTKTEAQPQAPVAKPKLRIVWMSPAE
ncbi:MAG: general secretion pathway protein GspK [Planctomycetes bacterium]|nr:general secretion pathway protein GspK [Planctomycetota bacterium]